VSNPNPSNDDHEYLARAAVLILGVVMLAVFLLVNAVSDQGVTTPRPFQSWWGSQHREFAPTRGL